MTKVKNIKVGKVCKMSPHGVVWLVVKRVKNDYGTYIQLKSVRGAGKWISSETEVIKW